MIYSAWNTATGALVLHTFSRDLECAIREARRAVALYGLGVPDEMLFVATAWSPGALPENVRKEVTRFGLYVAC